MGHFSAFFSSPKGMTFRFALLRVACLSALVGCLVNVIIQFRGDDRLKYLEGNIGVILSSVLAGLILFHHISSTFGPKLALPVILDFILVVIELAGGVIFTGALRPLIIRAWPGPSNHAILMYIALWTCSLSLLFLLFIRGVDMSVTGRRGLLQRYDFTRPVEAMDTVERPKAMIVLGGRTFWKTHNLGESRWLISLRALVATAIILGLVAFGLSAIFFGPIRELWMTPTLDLRAPSIPADVIRHQKPGWTIILTKQQIEPVHNGANFEEAVIVKSVWPTSDTSQPCQPVRAKGLQWWSANTLNYPGSSSEAIGFSCPGLETDEMDDPACLDDQFDGCNAYYHPEFLLSLNFTHIRNSSSAPDPLVHVLLGFGDDVNRVFRNTAPTTLISGVNLIGTTRVMVRQELTTSSLAALFVANYDTFFVADMAHVWADPRPLNSSLLPNGQDIATIRIKAQIDTSKKRIMKDQRDKNALTGVGTVGGLWTFLEGVFAALFGCSILKIMFSQKPLSVFGIAHTFQKDRLREAYIAEYPRIKKDVDAPRQERGLLTMICDHLLDVDIFSSSTATEGERDRFSPVRSDTMDSTAPLLRYPAQSADSDTFKRPVYTSQPPDSFSMSPVSTLEPLRRYH